MCIRDSVKPSNGSTDPKLDSASDSSTATRGDLSSAFNTPLTAQQQAAVNAAYGGRLDLGLNIPPTTTGGFPTSAAKSSGNTVRTAFSSGVSFF